MAIEREIRDTSAVLKRNPSEITSKYILDLPLSVRPRIRSIGYVYKDIALRMNQSAVMRILMGDRLYRSPGVAIRELVQNAIDAYNARTRIDVYAPPPEIDVQLTVDDEGRHWLEVRDNGIGMDEHVLGQFFLEIGNSYYTSSEFERMSKIKENTAFISRFGIGIISVFLIGDVLEVVACNPLSPRGDTTTRFVRVEDRGGLAFVKELGAGQHGTVVKVRLKESFRTVDAVRSLDQYLRTAVVRPRYPVSVQLTEERRRLGPDRFMSLRSELDKDLQDLEFVQLQLERFSNLLTGRVVLALGDHGGKLVHDPGGIPLAFGNGPNNINPLRVLEGFTGNRISVNGFLMTMKRTARIFRASRRRQIAFVFDIDVSGAPEVVYDVARDRIVGDGVLVVKNELRNAIEKGLKETGIYDRLGIDTQKALRGRRPGKPITVDEVVLCRVQELVPAGHWPDNIAEQIAAQLSLPTVAVGNALSALLSAGRVKRDEISPLAQAHRKKTQP